MEIRNALAYLRLTVERDSDPAFERVVNTPTRGIGEKTLEQLRQRARVRGLLPLGGGAPSSGGWHL